jgi:hypothetical protein
MEAIRNCPTTIGALAEDLAPLGFDLLRDLVAGRFFRPDLAESRIGIMVRMSVLDPSGGSAQRSDPYVFWTTYSIGDLGVMIGKLYLSNGKYVANFKGPGDEATASALKVVEIEPAIVVVELDRDGASIIAGREAADERSAVLVGGGAIGGPMADALVREGRFRWAIFDKDFLLPHNTARHVLSREDVGLWKADALAARLRNLVSGTEATPYRVDVLDPNARDVVVAAVEKADIVIDASASITVARFLSDMPGGPRRASAFFNPAGTDVVVLAEDAARSADLRMLEAAYYRTILRTPELANHLTDSSGEMRYSGSCRDATNRIPATRAFALAAIAAGALEKAIDRPEAFAAAWKLRDDGSVTRFGVDTRAATTTCIYDWAVVVPQVILDVLASYRRSALPSETGGAILGVIDVEAKRIDVVDVFSAPPDSKGTPSRFDRGVEGLREAVHDAQAKTADQIRYVGEWHSHPEGAATLPSNIDLAQIVKFADVLADDGVPTLMLIVGDTGITAAIGDATRPGWVSIEVGGHR